MSKISELSDGGSLQSTDYLIAVRSGGNVKVRANGAVSGTTGQFSTSLNVDGTVTADSATLESAAPYLVLSETDQTDLNAYIGNSAGKVSIRTISDDLNTLTKRFEVDHATGDISFYEDTGTTPKFFWDASAESLGIGTTSPAAKLVVTDNSTKNVEIGWDSSSSAMRILSFDRSGAVNVPLELRAQDIRFETDTGGTGTEAMRIDSSGNLLVGKATTDFGVAGTIVEAGGNLGVTRSSAAALNVNRLSTDGDIAKFYKAGAPVGSIGVNNGTNFYQASNAGAGLKMGSTSIVPSDASGASNDNAIDLGSSLTRFQDIYATNGTIQTSDANEKQDVAELDEAERRAAIAAKGLLRKFRWKDSVAEKGDDARIHFGIIAQGLQAAFEAEGLDAGRYAMFIHSTWTDEETGEERSRMGVRYSELLAFIIAAL